MDAEPALVGVTLFFGIAYRAFFLGVTFTIFSLVPLVVCTDFQVTRVTGVEGPTGIIVDLTITECSIRLQQDFCRQWIEIVIDNRDCMWIREPKSDQEHAITLPYIGSNL